MPRNKCNKVDKDKILLMNSIKSRLIKISMTVDKYVYKQKTISITQAKIFLDEISSYEPQCDGNVQYLQVIEKLTRFMNSIISDKDSITDNSINDKVNNSIEVETTDNKEHEINTTLPISKMSNNNDRNEYSIPNNQCVLPHLSKKGIEDLPYSNRNVNTNMEVENRIITEQANTNIHNSQTSTRDILINAVKTLEITSTGPLDLRKSTYNKSFIYSQGQIISNKTTLKPVIKADKPKTAFKTDNIQKLNELKINKAAKIQDESNKKKYNKSMNNEYVNSKTNIRILQDQPLETVTTAEYMQPNHHQLALIPYMQPNDSSIIFNPQNKTADSSKNNVINIAERNLKKTAHNIETKPDISIQNCTQNVITKNKNNADERKNPLEKPKNKRKTNKPSEVNEKTIKTGENKSKKVKRVNKSCKTTNAKKSESKQNVKNNVNIALSWFDNIKFIRQVDEQEYFTIKH